MASVLENVVLVIGGVWAVGLVGCFPLMVTERGRAMFDGRPTGFDPANYLLVALAVGFGHLLWVFGGVVLIGESRHEVGGVFFFGATYPVFCAIAAAVGLPRISDWKPDGGGTDGYVVLLFTALWYVFGVLATFVVVIFFALLFADWG